MSASGYLPSPWPAEDGGAARLQQAHGKAQLGLTASERLACTVRRTQLSTMTVLGSPGEVFLLCHSAVRSKFGLPTTCCVERIDPITLKTQCSSGRLAGGPMWPGGVAVHRNGDVLVVYGRYMHRLNRACERQASLKLPVDQPYNSFVVLDNGLVIAKNLSDTTPAQLSVVDPITLQPVGPPVHCPEPSVARLSALGNTVYVVGVKSIFRYQWDSTLSRLVFDSQWIYRYISESDERAGQSYGWDVVLDGAHAWFMDNGRHTYLINMLGRGVSRTPNRLIRVSLTDAHDHQAIAVCGAPRGSITNPPLVDVKRSIVVGFDSANRHLCAWRFDPDTRQLTPLWQKAAFGCASHMVLFPDTGEFVVNDYRRLGEEVVVLQIETGLELARVRSGGIYQGVVFPSVGWHRDLYWSSMGRLARIFVEQ